MNKSIYGMEWIFIIIIIFIIIKYYLLLGHSPECNNEKEGRKAECDKCWRWFHLHCIGYREGIKDGLYILCGSCKGE